MPCKPHVFHVRGKPHVLILDEDEAKEAHKELRKRVEQNEVFLTALEERQKQVNDGGNNHA